jgi:hypothetical protein
VSLVEHVGQYSFYEGLSCDEFLQLFYDKVWGGGGEEVEFLEERWREIYLTEKFSKIRIVKGTG